MLLLGQPEEFTAKQFQMLLQRLSLIHLLLALSVSLSSLLTSLKSFLVLTAAASTLVYCHALWLRHLALLHFSL